MAKVLALDKGKVNLGSLRGSVHHDRKAQQSSLLNGNRKPKGVLRCQGSAYPPRACFLRQVALQPPDSLFRFDPSVRSESSFVSCLQNHPHRHSDEQASPVQGFLNPFVLL